MGLAWTSIGGNVIEPSATVRNSVRVCAAVGRRFGSGSISAVITRRNAGGTIAGAGCSLCPARPVHGTAAGWSATLGSAKEGSVESAESLIGPNADLRPQPSVSAGLPDSVVATRRGVACQTSRMSVRSVDESVHRKARRGDPGSAVLLRSNAVSRLPADHERCGDGRLPPGQRNRPVGAQDLPAHAGGVPQEARDGDGGRRWAPVPVLG